MKISTLQAICRLQPSLFCLQLKYSLICLHTADWSWNVMAHGEAREGKWRANWRMEWVASTLYTTSEHGVSSITTVDAHTSAASSRLNWRPCRFKWTRPFRRKTKSGFCASAITFQLTSTNSLLTVLIRHYFLNVRHRISHPYAAINVIMGIQQH
jgi:hypothetical protein